MFPQTTYAVALDRIDRDPFGLEPPRSQWHASERTPTSARRFGSLRSTIARIRAATAAVDAVGLPTPALRDWPYPSR